MDTVPTSANQEDHVSMGVTAARKCRVILDNVEAVLGIELVCGAQAHEFPAALRAGLGAHAAHLAAREVVEPLGDARDLEPDLRAAKECLASGALVEAVEAAAGPLLP